MRILTISAHYPPRTIGGAEQCAYDLDGILVNFGHQVTVLSALAEANPRGTLASSLGANGASVIRVPMRRRYSAFESNDQGIAGKALWHLQDHFDPRNGQNWRQVISDFNPDIAVAHVIQGLGFNGLVELARTNTPTVIVLHDLSLACIRTSMFRNGEECRKQCATCAISSRLKLHWIRRIPKIGLVSPSHANLAKLASLAAIEGVPQSVIPNASVYPRPSTTPQRSLRHGKLKLLFVGRISQSKGVDFLLRVLRGLRRSDLFTLTVAGDGPELGTLRQLYGSESWVEFTGLVSRQRVSNLMGDHDLLCVPSLWAENFPGVVVQALQTGLPVFASDKGGIRELVTEKSGRLIESGNVVSWASHLLDAIEHPEMVRKLAAGAAEDGLRYEPIKAARDYVELFQEVMAS